MVTPLDHEYVTGVGMPDDCVWHVRFRSDPSSTVRVPVMTGDMGLTATNGPALVLA